MGYRRVGYLEQIWYLVKYLCKKILRGGKK